MLIEVVLFGEESNKYSSNLSLTTEAMLFIIITV